MPHHPREEGEVVTQVYPAGPWLACTLSAHPLRVGWVPNSWHPEASIVSTRSDAYSENMGFESQICCL